jgi:hypothetical protein
MIATKRKRPWKPWTPFDVMLDHLAESIGKGRRDKVPVPVMLAAIEHCRRCVEIWVECGIDFNATDDPPVKIDRLRIVSPPGTQAMLPLDVDHEPERKPQVSWSTAGSTNQRFGLRPRRLDSVSNARL